MQRSLGSCSGSASTSARPHGKLRVYMFIGTPLGNPASQLISAAICRLCAQALFRSRHCIHPIADRFLRHCSLES